MMDELVGLYRVEAGLREALDKLRGFRRRYETIAVVTRAESSIKR